MWLVMLVSLLALFFVACGPAADITGKAEYDSLLRSSNTDKSAVLDISLTAPSRALEGSVIPVTLHAKNNENETVTLYHLGNTSDMFYLLAKNKKGDLAWSTGHVIPDIIGHTILQPGESVNWTVDWDTSNNNPVCSLHNPMHPEFCMPPVGTYILLGGVNVSLNPPGQGELQLKKMFESVPTTIVIEPEEHN